MSSTPVTHDGIDFEHGRDAPLVAIPPVFDPPEKFRSTAVRFQGIPGIERTANGRLWATWYAGGEGEGPDNYVPIVYSDDDGATWTEPILVIDPPGRVRAFDPAIWIDPLGRLWLIWAQSMTWYDGRAGVWAIRCDQPDGDATSPEAWTPPTRLCHGIALNKPTVLGDGTWLMPSALWTANEECMPECQPIRGSNVYASTDQGETWTYRGGALVPKSLYDEHMVVERRDGSLLMFVRTTYGIGMSTSSDGGATWSPGDRSTAWGPNSRFFLRRLASGRLLLVTHKQPAPGAQKPGRRELFAMLSEDDGTTWQGGLMLDERDGVSYPDGIQATAGDSAGTIRVIYDRNRTTDREILMAVFTEDDILARAWQSPQSKQRVVVSKGTGPTK